MASKREKIKEAAQQPAFSGTDLLNVPPSMTDNHAIHDVLSRTSARPTSVITSASKEIAAGADTEQTRECWE